MAPLPEGVHALPRWEGTLRRGPAFPTIALQEARRVYDSQWVRAAYFLVFVAAVLYLGQLWTLKAQRGDAVHTIENFLQFVEFYPRWAALAVCAIAAGPALLEDSRRGALELYLARAVTKADYLAGKVLAVFGLTFVAIVGPAILYWAGSYLLFEEHPDRWAWVPLEVVGYAAMWAFVVTGLGLGLSLVARSSRAATLLLLGGVFVLDMFVANLLHQITRNDHLQVLSPLSSLSQQNGWLFGGETPFTFPWWWGLVTLGVLALLGWGLVVWKHPRLAGVEG